MKYIKGRVPTDEDKRKIAEIYGKIQQALNYKGEDEWYLFAAFQELANEICDYFMDIGYWEEPWQK